ncbi:MAG: peptidoglycan endopeptidase [Treponema sp.]|jgi:hypothetical protein|nr:peptidoglycan endopeptidase [Treponema sp.]
MIFLFSVIFGFFINTQICEAQTDHLKSFSDPARLWGNGVERVIEEAYRQYFKTRIIDGKIMNIRLPFAENNERSILLDTGWDFFEGGKGTPDILWPVIEEILDSEAFEEYVKALSSGRETVFIFDIPAQKWITSTDLFDIARMKAGSYRGLPHRPYVLNSGKGALESDIHNYLYCIGHVGIDCSGFVWQVLTHIGRRGGIDLNSALGPSFGLPRGADLARYTGTSFFNSKNYQIIAVEDKIRNLHPADVLLFMGSNGAMAHSAIIQSIDYKKGIIRYLQCTDEAPLLERGVHESFIHFTPDNTGVSLKDPSLYWTQKRFAPFPGEKDSPFSDDGERYRAFSEFGGGKVIRIRALVPVIEKLNKSR